MPIGTTLPIIFLLHILVWIALVFWIREIEMTIIAIFFSILELSISIYMMSDAVRRVELYSNKVICKSLLPKQAYETME